MALKRSEYQKIRAQAGRTSALSTYSSTLAKRAQAAEDDATDEQYSQGLLPIDQYITTLKQRATRVGSTPLQRQNISQKVDQLTKDYEDSQIQTAYKTGETFNGDKVDTPYLIAHEQKKLNEMVPGSAIYNEQLTKVAQLQDKAVKEKNTAYRIQKNLEISQMPEDSSERIWQKAKLYETLENQARLDGDTQQADIFATSKNNYTTSAKNADINDELTSARLNVSQTPTEGRGVPSAAAGAAELNGVVPRPSGNGTYQVTPGATPQPLPTYMTKPTSELTVGEAHDLMMQSGMLNGNGSGKPQNVRSNPMDYESLVRTTNPQSLIDSVSASYEPSNINSTAVNSALESLDSNTKRLQLLNSQKRDKQTLISKYESAVSKAQGDQKTSLTIALNNLKEDMGSIDNAIANTTQDRQDIVTRVGEAKQKATVSGIAKDVLLQEHEFNRTDTQLEQDFQKGKIQKAEYVVKKLQNAAAKQKFYQTVSDIYTQNDEPDKAQVYIDKIEKDQVPAVQKFTDVFSNYDRYEPVVDAKAGKNVELKDVGADKDTGVFNAKYALVGGKYHPVQNELATGTSGYNLSSGLSRDLAQKFNNSSYIYTRDNNGKLAKSRVAYVEYQGNDGKPVQRLVPIEGKGGVKELVKSGYYKGNLDEKGNLVGAVTRNYTTPSKPGLSTALTPNIDLRHPIQSIKGNVQQNVHEIFNAGKKVTDFFTGQGKKSPQANAGTYLEAAKNIIAPPVSAAETKLKPQMTASNGSPWFKGFVAGVPDEYKDIIVKASQETGVPTNILSGLLKHESINFNPDVVRGTLNSPVGAQGIAQFMPKTAAGLGIDPLDPSQAIPAAAKYLKSHFDKYKTWDKALAAYNAGPGAVDQYNGIPPYKETQNYVKNILGEANTTYAGDYLDRGKKTTTVMAKEKVPVKAPIKTIKATPLTPTPLQQTQKVLSKLNTYVKPTPNESEQAMNSADTNKNGRIDLGESTIGKGLGNIGQSLLNTARSVVAPSQPKMLSPLPSKTSSPVYGPPAPVKTVAKAAPAPIKVTPPPAPPKPAPAPKPTIVQQATSAVKNVAKNVGTTIANLFKKK